MFFMSQSIIKRNGVFPFCKECKKANGAITYAKSADLVRERRLCVVRYLGSRCVACGFDKSLAALDMHHCRGIKEHQIATLVSRVVTGRTPENVARLLHEASKCVCLCANCHRIHTWEQMGWGVGLENANEPSLSAIAS